MDQYYHPSWRSTREEIRCSLFILQQKSLVLGDEETLTNDVIEHRAERKAVHNVKYA